MPRRSQRVRIAGGVLLLAAFLCLFGLPAIALAQLYRADNYPGAVLISDQNLVRYVPNLVFRRTTSFRSDDPFNRVYNWYSNTFSLGPETFAQSNCILMARSWTTAWILEQQMSVMVCNTPKDQMMFVMRSVALRYGSRR